MDMGLTKSEIFTDKQNKLAGMMKALAHPARIAIIQQDATRRRLEDVQAMQRQAERTAVLNDLN
ncbi:MAG: hypothetical protein RLZZ301_1858, partial [Bacteroidota bacterium]